MVSQFIKPFDSRWQATLSAVQHDFYHLPEYVTVCGKHENGEPLAFYAEDEDALCLIPLLLRRLPEHLKAPTAWCDLVSPYGYPAPLCTHPQDAKRVAALHAAFRAAADELGACSVFLRLHPLFGGPVGVGVPFSTCLAQGETVSVDLTRTEEEMWRQTRDGHRSDIRRLQKLNFAPVMDDWNLYGEFARMYRQTMVRLRAESSYHFSDEYFGDLRTALGEKLHLCCVVSSAGRVAAGGLFTSVNDIMEYHLSGSDPEYHRLAPTKLVLHFMRLWGKRHGYSVLHLGGGVGSQNDALHEFKAGFSPDRHVFRTCRMITNEGRYAALTLRTGLPLDLSADLEADFFPAYRRGRMDRLPVG